MLSLNYFRVILWLVMCALFIAGFVQLFFPSTLASHPTWDLATGWQREIAFWNAAFAVMMGWALGKVDKASLRTINIGVMVLTLLLGSNHLWSVLTEQVPVWHSALVVLNYSGTIMTVIGELLFRISKRSST